METECHKLDLLLAAQLGRSEVAGGPSFEDHVAMIHEKAQLSERMEVVEGELQALDYLVTWLSVQLEDADSNPLMSNVVEQANRKREESNTLVSTVAIVHFTYSWLQLDFFPGQADHRSQQKVE